MDARSGIKFLAVLLSDSRYPMDAGDLEEAVRIASNKSPSAAFGMAQRYYASRHGSNVHDGYLGFAKGTRWLAVLRRDEGQAAFDAAVAELREVLG